MSCNTGNTELLCLVILNYYNTDGYFVHINTIIFFVELRTEIMTSPTVATRYIGKWVGILLNKLFLCTTPLGADTCPWTTTGKLVR